MKAEYQSPTFEISRIIFGEDILLNSDPEDFKSSGFDNFDDDDPFGF